MNHQLGKSIKKLIIITNKIIIKKNNNTIKISKQISLCKIKISKVISQIGAKKIKFINTRILRIILYIKGIIIQSVIKNQMKLNKELIMKNTQSKRISK